MVLGGEPQSRGVPMVHGMEGNRYGQQIGAPAPHWSTRPLPGRGTLAGRYVTAEPISIASPRGAR